MNRNKVVAYCRVASDLTQAVRGEVIKLEKFLASLDDSVDGEALTDVAVASQVDELSDELTELVELVTTFYLRSRGS